MNFTINQTNGIRENVTSALISKFYDLFITNRSSHTISLSGYLYSPTGYKAQMDALNSQYGPDLVIEVPEAGQYILIEDPNVLQILLNNNISSDGIGVSVTDAANANFTTSMFRNNTTITSFDQFRYFTRSNNNPVNELFRGCTNLKSIDLSEVVSISQYEFASSGIEEINAPSLQTIGEYSFAYSKVENIIDLGQVIEIPQSAFQNCPNLVSAVIPETVTSLGNSAFTAYNTNYSKVFTTITGLNNVQNFGLSCFNSQINLNLNGLDISSAVSIKAEAFSNCKLFSGNLNLKNLQILEHSVFRNTKISKILCLGKIASIPDYAFVSDTSYGFKQSLTEAYLPYECSSIGNFAFYYRTGLTTIKQYTDSVDNWVEGETPTYGDITRVTSFGNNCFKNCSQLSIPTTALQNAVSIGGETFQNCTLLNGVLDLHNLTSLGTYAFNGSGITSVTSLGSITAIPDMCFNNCDSLTAVTLSNTCTSISMGSFAYCDALQSIDLGGVTTIANQAFIGDTVLATVTGLSSLQSVGSGAFQNCPISIVDLSSIVELGGDSFFRQTSVSTSSVKLGHSCSKLAKWALRSLKDPNAVLYLPLITTYLNSENQNISGFQAGQMGQSALGHFGYNNSRVTWGQIYLPNLTSAAAGWTAHPNYFGLFAGLEVDVVYIKSLSTFPTGMVGGAKIKALIIDSTTPPTLTINSGADPFYNCNEITNIYVPDGYESVYESAWSNVTTFSLTGKIKPISDLTTYATEADWITAGRPLGLITAYMN